MFENEPKSRIDGKRRIKLESTQIRVLEVKKRWMGWEPKSKKEVVGKRRIEKKKKRK